MKHIVLALTISLTITAMHTKAQNQKPNIILILADDVGYKSLTCNGGNLYSTPNIDNLAKEGMRFTQCHASPSCSPSRHLLLTGKYNFRNYIDWAKMGINQKTIGNMMKNAGYKTGFFGKDQLGGGDQGLTSWGFDDYCVHDPLKESLAGNKYKNPRLYTHGAFIPDSLTLNKYGPDIVSDSLLKFIVKNKSNPFFAFYPMMLAHQPISPTPDDKQFADWNPENHDTSFFYSMMHYMDKKVGELRTKLKSLGIEKNTVIIFSADNGTPGVVGDYADDDSIIAGGKHVTTGSGTRVPLIVYWPGNISAGTINNDLIDFTDILPTLAGIAGIPVPTDYGKLDGVSFAPRLKQQSGTPRNWIFNDYVQRLNRDTLVRWAQTKTYKLYDTSGKNSKRLFYNISKDEKETNPLALASLTKEETIIRQQLLDVINGYIAQGIPLLSSTPSLANITDSSVTLQNLIFRNGGSTIMASGAVWSTNPYPLVPISNHTSTGVKSGSFSTEVTGLTANTTYYIRAYATNFAGTAYSDQVIFTTSLKPPVATKATEIYSNRFTANWQPYAGVTNYRLDVSRSATFTTVSTVTVTEGFDGGIILPKGWRISNDIIANTTAFATSSPSLEFTVSETRIVTKQLGGPATELKFWVKGLNTDDLSSFLVEGFDGNGWTEIANLTKLSKTGIVETFNANSNPPLKQNFIQFRFKYIKSKGTLAFDDVVIKYKKTIPFFVPGYDNLLVKTNSKIVTGLQPETNYYYRVRAVKDSITTGNSNVINVSTNKAALMIAATLTDSSSVITAKNSGLDIQVFPNPSATEFTLTLPPEKNKKPKIVVTDTHGKTVYQAAGGNNKYIFGKSFAAGEYFVMVKDRDFSKTIKIIKAN